MGGYSDQRQMGATYIPPQHPANSGVQFDAVPSPALSMVAPPMEKGMSWGKGMTFSSMDPVQQPSGGPSSSSGALSSGMAAGGEALGKGLKKFFKKKKKKGELDAFEQTYGEDADPADPGPDVAPGPESTD